MNVFRLVVALVFLGFGLLIGVLNIQPITLTLLFTQIETSSGVAIILSLLAGVLIGGFIVLAAVAWPLYNKLRRAGKSGAAAPSSAADPSL